MPESAGFVPKLTLATPSRGCLPYIFPELLPLPHDRSVSRQLCCRCNPRSVGLPSDRAIGIDTDPRQCSPYGRSYDFPFVPCPRRIARQKGEARAKSKVKSPQQSRLDSFIWFGHFSAEKRARPGDRILQISKNNGTLIAARPAPVIDIRPYRGGAAYYLESLKDHVTGASKRSYRE
jgi:hypothetical protein